MSRRAAAAGLLALAGGAIAAPPPILISDAWTRAAAAGMNAAGYMTIVNRGPISDRLIGASSPLAARVTLHQSCMIGSISVMRPVDAVAIAASGRVRLAPDGLHLMLEGLRRPLRPGERIPLRLQFQRAGWMRAWLAVRGGPMADMKM